MKRERERTMGTTRIFDEVTPCGVLLLAVVGCSNADAGKASFSGVATKQRAQLGGQNLTDRHLRGDDGGATKTCTREAQFGVDQSMILGRTLAVSKGFQACVDHVMRQATPVVGISVTSSDPIGPYIPQPDPPPG